MNRIPATPSVGEAVEVPAVHVLGFKPRQRGMGSGGQAGIRATRETAAHEPCQHEARVEGRRMTAASRARKAGNREMDADRNAKIGRKRRIGRAITNTRARRSAVRRRQAARSMSLTSPGSNSAKQCQQAARTRAANGAAAMPRCGREA